MNKNVKRGAGALFAVAFIAAIIGLYTFNSPKYPLFTFDASAAEGWWSSENINLQDVAGNNYTGEEPVDKLPVADMTVHHGEKGAPSTPEDQCFTSYSYYNYPLNGLDAAYNEYESRKKAQGTLKALEPKRETIATFEGDKEYELRQYDFSIKDEDILSGYQVGFVELEAGHMRIEGVCKTAKDLSTTLPVLDAVQLLER